MNLRNKPVDKRRLRKQDRQQLQTGRREQALKMAKRRRGSLAYASNREQFTTEQTPGSGGFTQGRSIQQARLRDQGQQARRAKGLRPEKFTSPVEDPR